MPSWFYSHALPLHSIWFIVAPHWSLSKEGNFARKTSVRWGIPRAWTSVLNEAPVLPEDFLRVCKAEYKDVSL